MFQMGFYLEAKATTLDVSRISTEMVKLVLNFSWMMSSGLFSLFQLNKIKLHEIDGRHCDRKLQRSWFKARPELML